MEKKVEKNFKCEICEKKFSSKNYQNLHKNRVHENNRKEHPKSLLDHSEAENVASKYSK